MYNPIKDIVFYYVEEPVLHTGKLGYLQYVLRTAVKYNTENKVWLIADNNPNIEGINFVSRESLTNELSEEFKESLVIGKIDVDENPDSVTQYGIKSLPTLIFFKNGKVMDKQEGSASKQKIIEKIKKQLRPDDVTRSMVLLTP